ncbi:DUF935 domain-containing protein [Emcibacter sp.]|uniref:DUF935 domain-containing protein n=1 Tax=Emcibacter sp. TaxID=1979954 RepID=UPI002AA84FB2|nr:DUF935 family protein [Emcibacter sp.]
MAEKKKIKPDLEVYSAPTATSMADGYLAQMIKPDDNILAERGNNPKLYEQILRDDQVSATIQQRYSAVTSCPYEVVAGGDSAVDKAAAEFVKEQLEKIGFPRKAKKMLTAIFYGYAVAEIIWEKKDGRIGIQDIAVRKRHRFRFDKEQNLRLLTRAKPEGIIMPDRKFWTFTTGADNDDQPYGMPLAHWLYWPCLFKREGVKFWMTFLDKFGSPNAVGKYPTSATPEERQKLLEAVVAFRQEFGVVVPEGMEIELLEATRGGTVNYDTLVARMDAAIAKVVLSQTMTTDNGSSLSQSEVHQDVRDEVVEADGEELCASFNSGPAVWLTEFNFYGAQPPLLRFITEDSEDLNQVADRDKKLYEMGYEPTPARIREVYGDGYQKRQTATNSNPTMNDPGTDGPEFAEGEPAAGRTQDDISEFVEKNLDQLQDQVGATLIQVIQSVAERSTDFDDFVENLLMEAPQIDQSELADLIARSTFNSRLNGQLEN